MNSDTKQLLDALNDLLRATEGKVEMFAPQQRARNLIERFTEQPDTGSLCLIKVDSDSAKIVLGKKLVATVVRASSGRWLLCDVDRQPLAKVEYSSPKKAMTHYAEKDQK